ncbi:hypothetical protein ACTQ49_13635 [Luteococcus sp. Sow4_B9]|uniref:hypothetical protein n=1 Tax=Luteococcus sp. Sow4_B9 TaxID=3438792 RepID=UPI003F993E4D
MDEERCNGITQQGLQCRREGAPWCYQHRPPSEAMNFDAHTERDDENEDQERLFDR